MTPWFPLSTADEAFVRTAPLRYHYDEHLAAPVARVWESLVSDQSLAAWGPMVSAVHWDAGARSGVGARREVVLLRGAVRVREQFTRWDALGGGRAGYTFHAIAMTVPGYRRFAEDYVVEPDGEGTRLRWTVAIEPQPWAALTARLLSPLTGRAFARMAADARRHFAR